jgi:putative FmdB family regulatory protein
MPLFEYQCQHCHKLFEVFTQRRDQEASPRCPACGGKDVERILSAFSGTSSSASCGTASFGFG